MTATAEPAAEAPPPADGGAGAEGPAVHPARPGMRGDLTQGPILSTLLRFSVPTLIATVLQTVNGTVNTIWVGRLLGPNALAATANANIVMFLMFAAIFGFGLATTVRVGQYFGARQIDAARRTFGTGVGFCTGIAVVVGLIGWRFTPALLATLGTPAESRVEALAYLRVVFITIPFGTVSLMLAQGLRGVGNSALPLRAMILTVALDIGLNPLLIRGFGPIPALGIAGSALSTALANFAGVVLMAVSIYAEDIALRLKGPELGYLLPRRSELGYVVTKGLPMGAQILLVSAAGVIMMGLVNKQGVTATAAYGASLQLWNYLQMPAFSISTAVSAMVAQNVGAGHHARVGRITATGLEACLAFTATLAVAIVLFSRPLLVLFLGSASAAVPLAQHIQKVCTPSFLLTGVMMILTGTMRAYGAVISPLVVLFCSLYVVRLSFYWLGLPRFGDETVWWTYPVGSIASLLMIVGVYRYGPWRRKRGEAFGPAPAN